MISPGAVAGTVGASVWLGLFAFEHVACLALKGPQVRIVAVGSDHHFGGDYARLVELILGPATIP